MKVILDTCALLWWSLDPGQFSQPALGAIEEMERNKNGITPSMAVWEIAIKVKNNKLDLGVPIDIYVSRLQRSDVVKIVPVVLCQLINDELLEYNLDKVRSPKIDAQEIYC